ncbi:MAG: tyrosine--tRNA ligase [Planctomycetes bacterium]|nr:tyrosine--tRNA ligase [Planctomycetota bacterium]
MDALGGLRERGYIQQVVGGPEGEAALGARLAEGPVTFYCGFDPTAASLHVGSLVPIMAMAWLQRSGHRPLVVLGGGTGLVGDPSGKTEARRLLTREDVGRNLRAQRGQFERYLQSEGPNGALYLDNAEWLCRLDLIGFLRDHGVHFRVNEMIRARGYAERLEREGGLSFLEFTYQLLQAYDFLHLHRHHGCTLQLGGDDQWANILAGTDLIRRVEGGEAHGLTFPLLTTASGAKMGKTERGAVWLDAVRTRPYELYQYWRNTDDRDVGRFLRLFTFLDREEVEALTSGTGEALNEAKRTLALEATALAHGREAAQAADAEARALFTAHEGGAGGEALPTTRVASAELAQGLWVCEAFRRAGLAASTSEARRLVRQGGAYVNGRAVEAEDRTLGPGDLEGGAVLLRAGKKRHARLLVGD